jgi:signal transduction histidine kinase
MMTDQLMEAALDLTSRVELADVLQEFVDEAAALTGATYSALDVLGERSETDLFVQHGVPEHEAWALGGRTAGVGLLGRTPAQGYLILNDVTAQPDFPGWPEGQPVIHSYLGLPLRLNGRVFGRICLVEKEGGFTANDAAQVEVLARAAGTAIANCRRHALSAVREGWLRASQEITTILLEGYGEHAALELIATRAREVARADACLLILPSVGGKWICEIANGQADGLVGVPFPDEGRAVGVLRRGVGLLVESLETVEPLLVPELRQFGPALYAPMMRHGAGVGVVLLLRRIGSSPFEHDDLVMAEAFAGQAALALELDSARQARDLAELSEERCRIGRDLHDLAIQQLFAAGMQMEAARAAFVARGQDDIADVLDGALGAVDDSVHQIRAIIESLGPPEHSSDLIERVCREVSLSRSTLGFAPELEITVDGEVVALSREVGCRVSSKIVEDVVAVVREGLSNVARHAEATAVRVEIQADSRKARGHVQVRIRDNGCGLDSRATRRSGVDNLVCRARRHNGHAHLTANPVGKGAQLVWQVPLG